MSRRLVTALGTSIVLAVPIIAAAPVAGANEEPYFTVAISEGKCLLSLNQANPQAKQNQQFLASPTKNRIQYFNSRIPGLEALVNELADAHTSEKTALAGGDNVGMTKSGDALTATKSKITELVTRSGMNEKDAEEIVKLANDYRKEGGPTQVSYKVEQKKIAAALTAATTALSTENQFANNNKSLPDNSPKFNQINAEWDAAFRNAVEGQHSGRLTAIKACQENRTVTAGGTGATSAPATTSGAAKTSEALQQPSSPLYKLLHTLSSVSGVAGTIITVFQNLLKTGAIKF
ncbi:hypothetical protein [Corynebacterium matruchotii]|uniref:hypothetical protein n=1 Tax=Corynebacterium matruchotii TaxID=43768 RepID=UPI0028E6748F|nr:hypothetical protein [Corynebacterium matruchotii]